MDSLTVTPALYISKDCPPGFSETLIRVEIDIFLSHYGMEESYAGVIIGIPSTAEWMEYPTAAQVSLTPMPFQNIKTYLEGAGLIGHTIVHSQADDTVEHAVEAAGCSLAKVAKSLVFLADGRSVMIVTAGDTRASNSEFKVCFHQKSSMIPCEQVGELIGHRLRVLVWQ